MKYILLLSAILFVNSVLGESDTSSTNSLYPVRVEIQEVKNRTLKCKVRNHEIIIDQPKEFGADDLGPTPPEVLAIAYGSCVVSTMQLIAAQRKVKVSDILVKVEGVIDFSKALGLSSEARAGFSELILSISFQSNMNNQQKQTFIDHVLKVGAAIDNVDNESPITCKFIE